MLTKLIILQPINLCNLNCSYCYVPGRRDPKRMSAEVLEAAIRSIFKSDLVAPSSPEDVLKLLWHAGEPLAAGIPFYQLAIELIEKYNINKIPYKMAIQTNATLIDQAWCDFFLKHNFEVSVSIDGPAFINDMKRVDWKGKGSFNKIIQGINYLKKNALPLYAICVLTQDSMDYPEEMYRFFLEENFECVCFNIDELEGSNNTSSFVIHDDSHSFKTAITRYKDFMSKIYDLWDADGRKIVFREFSTVISSIALKKFYNNIIIPNEDALAFAIITISKEGNITTFSPEFAGGIPTDPTFFSIGNVLTINSLDELANNSRFKHQLNEVKNGIEKCAKNCEYFSLCGGGSPSNKYFEHGTFDVAETMACRVSTQSLIDVILDKIS